MVLLAEGAPALQVDAIQGRDVCGGGKPVEGRAGERAIRQREGAVRVNGKKLVTEPKQKGMVIN